MLTKTENRLKPTETDRFPIISVGNFTNRKFRFRLAKTKKTDRTEPITPLVINELMVSNAIKI